MSRTARTRPATPSSRSGLLAGVLIGALALTGCGAGQVAGTAQQQAAVAGNNTTVGPIAVRDAVIVFAEQPVEGGAVHARGSDAPLSMTIVNEGTESDRLVSASSPWASSVEITGTSEVPAGRSIVVEGAAPEVLTPTTGIPTSGTRPTPSAAPSSAPASEPAAAEGTQIVLTGLLDDIRAGVSYDVVLVFERAGEVRFQAPVGSTEEPREDEPAE
ncbi:copper chaperone PCu(A)C [Pseudonocardia abyssalis]|uniref:Copper chaperone PCu(A)C n=1 Tax=Pseudonocardia abyssalis TaxID=2792008 RepID=A0ABS6UZP9_9PSEU|nr:copper chaperone PCu(A)C [Pseudonocardia abyssalis]MBW0114071.1 copper chaperone PCu(A)C [Pseudonocardia abyssalis]MBW0137642.1 copper chaperone PCu(A)C [Pseudonocardia abyssalis]